MEYQIGDFAKISRLGIKTLRYYHQIGLLLPARIDPVSGYRYYDGSCLRRVQTIQRLKALEFPLEKIRMILSSPEEDENLLEAIRTKITEVEEKISFYQDIRDRLNAFIRSEKMPEPVREQPAVKQVPDQWIASIRFTGRYTGIGEKIERLYRTCGALAMGKPFSLYYDNQAVEGKADIEVCLPVSSPFDREDICSRVLPGGEFISVIHKGAYEHIWTSYQIMVDYVNRNHVRTVLPSREIYLKGVGLFLPGIPENYLTEIQFEVK